MMIPIRIRITHKIITAVLNPATFGTKDVDSYSWTQRLPDFDWIPADRRRALEGGRPPEFWLGVAEDAVKLANTTPLNPDKGAWIFEAFNASVPDCEATPRADVVVRGSRDALQKDLAAAAHLMRQRDSLHNINAVHKIGGCEYEDASRRIADQANHRLQGLAVSMQFAIDPMANQDDA